MPRPDDTAAVGHNPMNPRHSISPHCRKGSGEGREVLTSYCPIVIRPEDEPGRRFKIHCHPAIWLATCGEMVTDERSTLPLALVTKLRGRLELIEVGVHRRMPLILALHIPDRD